MAGFHSAIKDGQIPPRWSSMLSYGWGTPVFNFNWSLPYWMAEPFLFAGWTTTDAQKAVVASAIPLSYLTMFMFLAMWLGFWPAITGAVLSVWAVFRIYLLYISGSSGMEIGFIFWPLLFLSVLLLEKKKYRLSFLLGSTATALTLLSHQVMFLMIQPMFWIFVLIREHQTKRCGVLPRTIFSFAAGLLLSAYFWLPAIAEKEFIRISNTKYNYLKDFISPIVLFLQPKLFTLGGDDWWKHIYATGWVFLGIILISLTLIITSLLRRNKNKKSDEWILTVSLFIGFFLLSLFLITPYAAPVWALFPLLQQFIYPIRFQALALFCGSVVAALTLSRTRYAPLFGGALVLLAIVLNIQAIPVNPKRTNWSDDYYFYGDSTSDMFGEFLPKTANTLHFFTTPDRYERHDIGRIIQGTGTVTNLIKKSASASFIVQAQTDVSVAVNQLYFHGWEVKANNTKVSIKPYGYGEILFTISPGTYLVTAKFRNTPIRTLGNILSVSGLLFMIWYMFLKQMRLFPRIFR